jgi:hypothetical protein
MNRNLKRTAKIFAALVFMLFLGGCINFAETSQVPSGIYLSSESGSEEKIKVKGSEVVLHIKHRTGVYYDRQLSHSVNPDGRITFRGISSNEWSILRYAWTFDGKVIWKEDIKTKQKVSFVRN